MQSSISGAALAWRAAVSGHGPGEHEDPGFTPSSFRSEELRTGGPSNASRALRFDFDLVEFLVNSQGIQGQGLTSPALGRHRPLGRHPNEMAQLQVPVPQQQQNY